MNTHHHWTSSLQTQRIHDKKPLLLSLNWPKPVPIHTHGHSFDFDIDIAPANRTTCFHILSHAADDFTFISVNVGNTDWLVRPESVWKQYLFTSNDLDLHSFSHKDQQGFVLFWGQCTQSIFHLIIRGLWAPWLAAHSLTALMSLSCQLCHKTLPIHSFPPYKQH